MGSHVFSRHEERVSCFDTFKIGVVDPRERRFVRWEGEFTGDGTIHDEKKKFFEYNPGSIRIRRRKNL